EVYRLRTLRSIEAHVGCMSPTLVDLVRRDTFDPFWRSIDFGSHVSGVDIPGLHSGGWWDHLTTGTIGTWRAAKNLAASPRARGSQRLVVGPWPHHMEPVTRHGAWDFGPEAAS